MNTDVLLLAVAGLLALASGGMIVLLAPGRYASLLAGASLALLGVLQIGFARVALDVPWGGEEVWFQYVLAFTLPTTTLWLLFSAALGRPTGSGLGAAWKRLLAVQTLLSLAAVGWTLVASKPALATGDSLPLGVPARVILGLILLNVLLFTVNFEATYLSLPRRERRSFRPALAGIVAAAIYFAALAAGGILAGRAAVSDIAMGAAPVALLAFLLPVSFIRGRLGQARLAPSRHPVTATTSFGLAASFLAATAALLWLTHAMGFSMVRGLWLLGTGGLVLIVALLAVSNRVRRRLERAFAPVWSDWRGPHRRAVARAVAPLERCTSVASLSAGIASNACEIAGVAPVTFFLLEREARAFRPVASTLDPVPDATVGEHDPLAMELRRARRAIRLHERTDDLEYVPIYVENGVALERTRARAAVPIWGEFELIGFLLCGPKRGPRAGRPSSLFILDLAAKRYGALLDRLGVGRDVDLRRPI